MLIKDDYITVDFKNNKLIQKQINEPVTETIKNEFNAFCTTHLAQTN
jgi:ribosomal protein S17E